MGHPQCFELGEVGHPYTALPYEKTSVESFRERVRMRISGSKEDWIAANDKIKHALDAGSQDPNGARVTWSISHPKPFLLHLNIDNNSLNFYHTTERIREYVYSKALIKQRAMSGE